MAKRKIQSDDLVWNGEEMSEALLRILSHGLRRNILRALHVDGATRSPRELAEEFQLDLSNVSYHFSILRTARVIKLRRTQQVRGSTAHFYASAVSKNPQVRTILAATAKEDEVVRKGPQGRRRRGRR